MALLLWPDRVTRGMVAIMRFTAIAGLAPV
jgi:hypothetical protein